MKLFKTVVMVTLLAGMDGCVPNVVTYYRPSVSGGEIVKPHCVPTESLVDFNLPSLEGDLRVRALAQNGSTVYQIALFFSGRKWKEMHFVHPEFRILNLDNQAEITPSSIYSYRPEGRVDLTSKPYFPPPAKPGLSRFYIQINTSDPLPDNFELIGPAVVVDGKEIPFPVIRFEQKIWAGLSPFNC